MLSNLKSTWMVPIAVVAMSLSVQVANTNAADPTGEQLRRIEIEAAKIADHAAKLQQMAEQPNIYDVSTHEFEWSGIKASLNEAGKLVPKLQEKTDAPAWQKEIIDEISGLLEAMATQTEAGIKFLNENPETVRLMNNRYRARIASVYHFAQQVDDLVDYADTRTSVPEFTPTS